MDNFEPVKHFVKCGADSFEILISSDFIESKDTDVVVESTSLRKLKVKNNYIRHLDVSRCTNLEELVCNNNSITQLTLNENLKQLFCGHNKLKRLTLNKQLEEVDCSNNMLEVLNLNKYLKVLYCENNRLTRLQLNRNITYAECSHNLLTELTLNKKLEVLFCNNNFLTEIHVNEKLITLFCPHNQLTKIKMSSHAALNTLFCSDNQLTNLEIIDSILSLSCKKNKLTTIKLNKTLTKRRQDVRKEIDPDVVIIPFIYPGFKTYSPTSDDDICTICYETDGEGMIKTDCNHIFHHYCIVKIYGTRCPYCREEIEQLK